MARLTLLFKDQKLKLFELEGDETLIGRDDGCAICIDSLAIEPQHARIRQHEEQFVVEPISAKTVVSVNEAEILTAHTLANGDLIQIGKHTLAYSLTPVQPIDEIPAPAQTRITEDPHGWLQIQSGSHLGRTIRLNKAFTRIGSAESHLAVIARRGDGYVLSHLSGEQTPEVNKREIGESTHALCNEDFIRVGELQVQFFAETVHRSRENSEMDRAGDQAKQRKFTRIPFDVGITLHCGDEHWESTLSDISLHGALIHTPRDFEPVMSTQYRLDIHLEGGPDIVMDVHIAHQEEGHTGLRCDDIDVDSITHLRRLVELNLGDPELLERELSALAPAESV